MLAFSCDTAAAALGFPGATVALCKEASVLRGLFRVRLEGTPNGRLDRTLLAEGGVVSAASGGQACAAFLRRSSIWTQPRIAVEELRDVLDAFDARPPGFDRQSGPRTVDDRGKPAWIMLPELAIVLETSRATWDRARGGGVSHTPSKVRATLTGSPTAKFVWVIEQQSGAAWVPVETLALEP